MNTSTRFRLLTRHAQAGLSLIELMISMALGLLLTVIVLQIFLGSKNTYRAVENHSRLQENGRYLMDEMSRDIRMAGYLGCSKNAKINLMVKSTADAWLMFNEAVHGYESADASTGLTAAEVLSGTDIIRVQRASAADANLTGNLESDDANFKLDGNPEKFAADETLIISDCASADVFCATAVSTAAKKITIAHAASCNEGTAPKLSKLYGADAQVMRLSTNTYYIGTGKEGCKANMLCRKVLKGKELVVEELIDGVENMKIQYGEDTDGDSTANRFVTAASISDWNNIVSVRLNLLFRSNDINLTTSPQPYTFNGTTTTPAANDRRMRRVFSSTVTLRNRTL